MLIIKDKIQQMIKGYPTVSDKYNVSGAVLAGTNPVQFGELVKLSSTEGYFEAIGTEGITDVEEIGGFVLATNVKLAQDWPGTTVQVNSGEAFNLLVSGFMAIELDSQATMDNVKPNAPVYVILATGKITTSDKYSEGTVELLPGVLFTGTKEDQGTSAAHKYIAEIYIK